MSDNCPIPKDAAVGDWVTLNNGRTHRIEIVDRDDTGMPYFVGGWWMKSNGDVPGGFLHCVAFQYADGRKTITPREKKTQPQVDGAYLRACIVKWRKQPDFTISQFKRILAIADRLEGK
jgi:hypothetical protein